MVLFLLVPIGTLFAWTSSVSHSSFRGLNQGPGDLNHPVDVVPTSAVHVPPDWPVGASGAITCLTCHVRIPGESVRQDPELRGIGKGDETEDSVRFCSLCHLADGPQSASAMHWLAGDKAHIQAASDEWVHSGGRLDGESLRCLGCHDGVAAGETSYETGHGSLGGSFGAGGRNHPIGITYPKSGRNRNDVKYTLPAMLPKSIRLPEGTVGCVSCHDLYSGEPNYLSVPIAGSALCFSCHDMN